MARTPVLVWRRKSWCSPASRTWTSRRAAPRALAQCLEVAATLPAQILCEPRATTFLTCPAMSVEALASRVCGSVDPTAARPGESVRRCRRYEGARSPRWWHRDLDAMTVRPQLHIALAAIGTRGGEGKVADGDGEERSVAAPLISVSVAAPLALSRVQLVRRWPALPFLGTESLSGRWSSG